MLHITLLGTVLYLIYICEFLSALYTWIFVESIAMNLNDLELVCVVRILDPTQKYVVHDVWV